MSDPQQMTLPFVQGSPTSREAAQRAEEFRRTDLEVIKDFLRLRGEEGATDEEIQRKLKINPSTERPRRVELVRAGFIKDSGFTRLTRAKRKAAVWVWQGRPVAFGRED